MERYTKPQLANNRFQKISIDAGFTCPNIDGSKGTGGCIYCHNPNFLPASSNRRNSIEKQINDGIRSFKRVKENQRYLAFFQAYTNTHAPLNELKGVYEQALSHPKIEGLVIATRPDSIDESKLDYLASLNEQCPIFIEYGVESCYEKALVFMNRCHTVEDAERAIRLTKVRGLEVGVHIILGVPGLTREEELNQADIISQWEVDKLKLHQLQVQKNTRLASLYAEKPEIFNLFEVNEYIGFLTQFIERLSPKVRLERFVSQTKPDRLIAPIWNIKNYEFRAMLQRVLEAEDIYQGKKRLVS